jgi:hypothetical protein
MFTFSLFFPLKNSNISFVVVGIFWLHPTLPVSQDYFPTSLVFLLSVRRRERLYQYYPEVGVKAISSDNKRSLDFLTYFFLCSFLFGFMYFTNALKLMEKLLIQF